MFNDQERITVTSGAINRGASPAVVELTLEVDGRAIQKRTLQLEARRLGIGQLRSVYAGVQVHPWHRQDR